MTEAVSEVGKMGVVAPVKPFNERINGLLREFVGKPVTSALLNELAGRLSKVPGVKSVIAEGKSPILLAIEQTEGKFVGSIGDTLFHLAKK